MPKIKIKRGDYSVSGGGSSVPALDAGELAVKTGGTDRGRLYVGVVDGDETPDQVRVSYADDAANSVYAQKIGTSSSHPSVGSSVRPVYVDGDGKVTASTGNVGQDSDGGATKWAKPIFMQNGVLTVMSGNAGNHYSPVFMLNGEIRQLYADVGSDTQPVYLSNGSITQSTSDVGMDEKDADGGFKPIYMHNGVFTVATRPHGGDTVPVYVDNGGIRRCRGNVGSSINPIYMDDGEFKPATGNCGGSSATKPLYMSNGKLYPTNDYAGGTKVVLNNIDKGHQNATIYAPDEMPSNAGNAVAEHTLVEWYDYGAKARWATDYSVGSSQRPVYLASGVLKECDYYAGATRLYFGGGYYMDTHRFYTPVKEWSLTDTQVYQYIMNWAECPDGEYLIIARDTTSAHNLYSFHVDVIKRLLTSTTHYVYSNSYVTQPGSGNPHSCRVRVNKTSTDKLYFLLEDDSSELEFRLAKIVLVSSHDSY